MLDLEMHDRVTGERVAHTLRAERAAAQRDHARVRPLQQLKHHLLLARAKGLLAQKASASAARSKPK